MFCIFMMIAINNNFVYFMLLINYPCKEIKLVMHIYIYMYYLDVGKPECKIKITRVMGE